MAKAKAVPPALGGVLETVAYFSDQARCERFYVDVLGMRLIGREPERSLFFRAGPSVFLLFDASHTQRSDQRLPPHGARGVIHTCFVVAESDYSDWKTHLASAGVPILKEVSWPRGESFYFEDSEGNLLEIANNDIWPA